jgi:pSer/pThr/pTyr-binding forkhead associated (FHA) protein
MENGKFIFEDMSSTNGSWLRLSNEQEKSDPHTLSNKDEIKIGL